jgi:hypothetical protein
VNKPQNEEKPLYNIERSPIFLLFSVLLTATLALSTWWLLKQVSPYGFLVMVPAVMAVIQTAWLLMNPFAIVFERRLEIRQSLFNPKERFFNDLDKVSENKKGEVFITYTDGEVEKLNLFGIKPSDKTALVEQCRRQIGYTLTTRA